MDIRGTRFYVSPLYSNLYTPDYNNLPPAFDIARNLDTEILRHKLTQLGILTNENQTKFGEWTQPLPGLEPGFISLVSDWLSPKQRAFSETIGTDNLLHFLQTHLARRLFMRQHSFYHFSQDLFKIVFPCGLVTDRTPRTQKNCSYRCRWFFQSCSWHHNLHDPYLIRKRQMFTEAFHFQRDVPEFWLSLVMDVHCHWNRRHAMNYEESVSKTANALYNWKESKGLFSDVSLFDLLRVSQAAIQCTHCAYESPSASDLNDHISKHHPEAQNPTVKEQEHWADYAKRMFSAQIDMIISAYSTVAEAVPAWISKYRRFLVNLLSSVVTLISSTNWQSVVASIAVIVNEILSEFPTAAKTVVERMGNCLKQVMSRFFPRTQAQPTVAEDTKAANESFITSLFQTFYALVPWAKNIDAGLLKARMQRITLTAQCLNTCYTAGLWFLMLFEKIYCWVQIYFFGMSESEAKEMIGIFDTKKVEEWIAKVREFEVKQVDGLFVAGAPTLLNDEAAQKKVIELKLEGEELEAKLALKGSIATRGVASILKAYQQKVEKWFKVFEDSIGKKQPKHAPLMIYLYGDPGVGKSYCVDYILQALKASIGETYNPDEDKFSRDRKDQYHEGYKGQFCYLIDDFLQVTNDEMNDSEIAFLIDAGSRAPLHLNMAAVEKKAFTYFTSPVVIVTSNVALSPSTFSGKLQSYGALARRFDLVVEVRKTGHFDSSSNFDEMALSFRPSHFHLETSSSNGGYFVDYSPVSWEVFRNIVCLSFISKQEYQKTLDNLKPLPSSFVPHLSSFLSKNSFSTIPELVEKYCRQNCQETLRTWPVYGPRGQLKQATYKVVGMKEGLNLTGTSDRNSDLAACDQSLNDQHQECHVLGQEATDDMLVESVSDAEVEQEKKKKKTDPDVCKSQAVETVDATYLCTRPLVKGKASPAQNNCLFDSLRQCLNMTESPLDLRSLLSSRWIEKNPGLSQQGNPFRPGPMISTSEFAFVSDVLNIAICLHWTDDQGKSRISRWDPEHTTNPPIAHIHHDAKEEHFSPLIPKPESSATILSKAAETSTVTCPVSDCTWSYTGKDLAPRLFRHYLQSCYMPRTRDMHMTQIEQLKLVVEALPKVDMVLPGNCQPVLKELTLHHKSYSPYGSPWTLDELIGNQRNDLLYQLLDFYRVYDRHSLWKLLFMAPACWISKKVDAVVTYARDTLDGYFSSFSTAMKEISNATSNVNSILVKMKKWSLIGLLSMVVGAILTAVVYRKINKEGQDSISEGYGGSDSFMTRADKKKKNRIIAESAQDQEMEGYGPSESLKVRARKLKQMNRIEMAIPIEPEQPPLAESENGKLEITYKAPFEIENYLKNVTLRRAQPNEQAHYTVLKSSKGKREVICPGGIRLEYETANRSIAQQNLDLCNIIADTLPTSQAAQERMQMVKDLIGKLPVSEGTSDPSLMSMIYAVLPNLFKITNRNSGFTVRGFFLEGNIAVFPAHIIKEHDLSKPQIMSLWTCTCSNVPFAATSQNTIIIPEKDVAFADMSSLKLPQKRSIVSKFLTRKDALPACKGFMLVPCVNPADNCLRLCLAKSLDGIVAQEKTSYIDSSTLNSDVKFIKIVGGLNYHGETQQGECGSLIVRLAPRLNHKFLGFHTAGSISGGTGSILTQEFLEENIAKFKRSQAAFEDPILSTEDLEEFFDCELSGEEDDMFYDLPFVSIVGNADPKLIPSQPTTTDLRESPLFEKLIETQTLPTRKRPFMKDDQLIDPLKKALMKLESPQVVFDPELVQAAALKMENDYSVKGWLKFYGSLERGKLTDEENILGNPDDVWIKPINMHTSAGYPYVLRGGKEHFIDTETPCFKEPLKTAIQKRESLAQENEAMPALIIDTMKDERLPKEKVEAGKVRIFNVCPLDFNVLVRKYFTRFLAQMMNNHILGEVSVGINAHSEEWKAFYDRMHKSGSHWIAGDYGAWDKRLPYQVAMALLPMVEHFYQQFCDYDPRDANVRRILLEQTLTSSRIAIKGKKSIIYRAHQSMPSGVAITAVYNSLINSLLFRIIFAELAMKHGWSRMRALNAYSTHVTFAAYGDDHIARVSDPVFEFFNMVSISEQMAEHNIEYTSATKQAVMEMEVFDKDLIYLKRSFRDDHGILHAPMKLSSILDILNWVKAKDEEEAKEAQAAAVLSVIIELSHHPKQDFDYWYLRILSVCSREGIRCPYMTYDDAFRARLSSDFENDYEQY